MAKYEIRLSGSGGQGMITAGIIFAHAAAIYAGKNAVQSQSYGPEARGGASKAEIIISDSEINYPKVTNPDILAALTQEAYDKYSKDLKDNSIVVVDSSFVKQVNTKGVKLYSLPITLKVNEVLKKGLTANIATVAIINSLGNLIPNEDLLKSVLTMIPKGSEDINIKSFNIGIELVEKVFNTYE